MILKNNSIAEKFVAPCKNLFFAKTNLIGNDDRKAGANMPTPERMKSAVISAREFLKNRNDPYAVCSAYAHAERNNGWGNGTIKIDVVGDKHPEIDGVLKITRKQLDEMKGCVMGGGAVVQDTENIRKASFGEMNASEARSDFLARINYKDMVIHDTPGVLYPHIVIEKRK